MLVLTSCFFQSYYNKAMDNNLDILDELPESEVKELLQEKATIKSKRQTNNFKGYPWELEEKEVLTLLCAFPKQVITREDVIMAKENDIDLKPQYVFLDAFLVSGLYDKCRFRSIHKDNPAEGDRMAYMKFRQLVRILERHPSLYTPEMKDTVSSNPILQEFFTVKKMKIKGSIVPPKDPNMPVVSELSPLARQETVKLDITNQLIDKIQMIVGYITPSKIKAASLGNLTKSLENLMKAYSMFKGESSPQTFIQMNIKELTLQEKRNLSNKMAEDKQ